MESSDRDTKLETSISYMEKRLEQMETLTAKMSETLNRQQAISESVANLVSKIENMESEMKDIKKDVITLQNSRMKTVYDSIKKILWLIIPLGITSIYGYVISHSIFKK